MEFITYPSKRICHTDNQLAFNSSRNTFAVGAQESQGVAKTTVSARDASSLLTPESL